MPFVQLGETVLMKASVKNELGIMDTLLSCGASVNAKDFVSDSTLPNILHTVHMTIIIRGVKLH